MSEVAARYRRVAGGFTRRAKAVPAEGWDAPAPCDGWVARDIVRHMVSWMPGFFLGQVGLDLPAVPPVDDDPLAAWLAVSDAIQRALDDPTVASRELQMQIGRRSLAQAVAMFGIGDVLIHTWDLARAVGLDEALDPDEVHRTVESMALIDEQMLREGGQFAPAVDVPDDADEQTRLLAFTGRRVERAR